VTTQLIIIMNIVIDSCSKLTAIVAGICRYSCYCDTSITARLSLTYLRIVIMLSLMGIIACDEMNACRVVAISQ